MTLGRRAVLGSVAGLAASRVSRAQPSDVVRIALLAPSGIGTFDPHRATAHHDRMVASWVHGALVRFRPGSIDPAGIEPDLAERWEVSPDRLSWTFFLRQGVEFHRGFGPVLAEDVVSSLGKAASARSSAYAGDFAAIDRVEALDAATVRITLKQPIPSLLGLLSNYSGGFILSRRATEQDQPIGFGPFMVGTHLPGQSLHLVANEAYVRGRPRLRGIDVRFVSSLAASDLAFGAGEVDITEGQQDQAWISRTRQRPGTVVDVAGPPEISWLHLNVRQKPLDDPGVRRAIALAVDRAELVAWRGASLVRPARSVIPSSYWGFSDGSLPDRADPARARQLLAEAGYGAGVTVRTVHTSNPVMLSAVQVVQAQLRRAGITLEVQVVEHLTYNQMIRQDLSPLVHYAAARFPVADTMLTQFFHGRSTVGRPGGVTNFSHCTAADAELDEARVAADPERQLELWAEAQRKVLAADCAVPLMETMQVWARCARFEYGFPYQGTMATGPLITERSHFVA